MRGQEGGRERTRGEIKLPEQIRRLCAMAWRGEGSTRTADTQAGGAMSGQPEQQSLLTWGHRQPFGWAATAPGSLRLRPVVRPGLPTSEAK